MTRADYKEELKEALGVIDLDPRELPPRVRKEMLTGFIHEMEHLETVGNDIGTVLMIALDHLKEREDYYEVLEKAGL